MKDKRLVTVVMAGGKGERFWPKSRLELPKPFLKLSGTNSTLIQSTVQRLAKLVGMENIYIVTGQEYLDITREQLPEISIENIIAEPIGRNTAACIGLAAVQLEEKFPDSIMLVVPSDHMIQDEDQYRKVLKAAAELAAQGEYLVTVGISPDYPETGYGYIKLGEHFQTFAEQAAFKIANFVEKPNLSNSEQYLKSGEYLWNSGIFVWQTRTIRQVIRQHLASLHAGLERIKHALGTEQFAKVLRDEYLQFANISIDHGVMELAEAVFVFKGNFGWDDMGTWIALERVFDSDEDGNIILGQAVEIDSSDCIVDSPSKLVALIGVENMVIVDTEDIIMVCCKEKVQKIKELVKLLKEQQMYQFL